MAATSTYETIIYHVEDHVAYLTMNRPESMNAFNRQMTREFIAACQAINADPDVRVAIVTGAGERALLRRARPQGARRWRLHELRSSGGPPACGPGIGTMHRALTAVDRPTIAAIRGYALGGGLEMALAATCAWPPPTPGSG